MNNNKPIGEISTADLKAFCYDTIVQINTHNKNLNIAEAELVKRATPEVKPTE